jgi:hypothetical protein
VEIGYNDALTSLQGLDSLVSVGGDLAVTAHPSLLSLQGLGALASVGDDLFVDENDVLTSLGGLQSLQTVGGDLLVYYDPALLSFDLPALASVGDDLIIVDNDVLALLSGLQTLQSVGGLYLGTRPTCCANGNPVLTDVTALYGLTTVTGEVVIVNNPLLTDAAAQVLVDEIDSIGGNVTVSGNE